MLLKNIKALLQTRTTPHPLRGEALQELPFIENAWLSVKNGKIAGYGEMHTAPAEAEFDQVKDLEGKMVLPAWVDSHTHTVFAKSREEEFKMRIDGHSYQEIAAAGGGILNSALKLQQTSEAELLASAKKRIDQIIKMGTGSLEIKSGYGLTLEAELKMLRVIQKLKSEFTIPIKASFLGAHALPKAFQSNRQDYIRLIIKEMLPAIAEEQLADYIDVFCEKVAFTPEETEQIIIAGKKYGLKAKIHTNQFYSLGGIEKCVEHEALSVDHLEVVTDAEAKLLGKSETIATLLPTAPFFLNDPYQPARKLIDQHAIVALATDFNPGSSPSANMNLVISLACTKLGMKVEEAINAATINSAFALELEQEVGSIAVGKRANLIITEAIDSYAMIPYSFGRAVIDKVMINGAFYD